MAQRDVKPSRVDGRTTGSTKRRRRLTEKRLNGYEKAFGREHPYTLMSVKNLAMVLLKYEAAEEMSRRALDGREMALRKEHPNTLMNVSNLASVLRH